VAIGATDHVDEFVLSFEVGAIKPDAAIFETTLGRLGVEPAACRDGRRQRRGRRRRPARSAAGFILVDPLPTSQRTDGLTSAPNRLRHHAVGSNVAAMPEERIRPPRWLKPINKVLMVLLRLGVPISRAEAPVVLTVPRPQRPGRPRLDADHADAYRRRTFTS